MPFLWAIGLMAASLAITVLMTPKPVSPKAAAFEDFDYPTVEEGTSQPIIFGDVWLADWTVLWYGNYRTSAVKSDGGKK